MTAQWFRKQKTSLHVVMITCASFAFASRLSAAEPAKPARTNAASAALGALIRLELSKDATVNRETPPDQTFDLNCHSRCVITGVPYTFHVELPETMEVDCIAFAHSDYETEAAPKDVIIELEDGTKLEQALELKRPDNRKAAWQEVAIGKKLRKLKITVTSNHPGKVAWGGLGDIAVFTAQDLSELLKAPDHDPAAPVFVAVPPLDAAGAPVKVNLPPKAAPGEHPCLLFTRKELEQLRADARTERGKPASEHLLNKAAAALELKVEFPDPKGPGAQLKDRGDELAKQHDRLSMAAGNLGVAYLFTEDAKYAAKAREILIGYAERYEQYPEHRGVNRSDSSKVMAQRLSEAMWLVPLLHAFDSIHGTLSEADRKQIETGLIRPCLAMIHRKDPRQMAADLDRSAANWRTEGPPAPKSTKVVGNWINFYNLATVMAGAVLGDADLVNLAVYDTKKNILEGIGSDGMWGEGAIGYQMFALQALTAIMETAARQGHDLWGFAGARIKQPFDANFRFAYPDGTAPGINDSGRVSFSDWQGMVYDYAWLRYGDARYARLVNACPRQFTLSPSVYYPTRVYDKVPEPEAIHYPSTVFKDLGYAILRGNGTYALLDYGPHGGPHGHLDKLNLILYAAGDELGGEPRMHRYEDPLHGSWTRETVAHNTMAVDERSQTACAGRLTVFKDAGTLKVMRGETSGAYPGVVLDRTIVLAPGLLVDIYLGRSKRERAWDRTFRYAGQLEGWAAPAEGAKTLGTQCGYENLQVVRQAPAEALCSFQWKTSKTALQVVLAGAQGQSAVTALGPDGEHVVLARQRGTAARFGAALRVAEWGGEIKAAEFLDTGASGVACFRAEQDGAETLVFVAGKPGEWTARGWTSDARVLCVQSKDGKLQRALLAGGAKAAAEGVTLAADASGFASAEREGDALKQAAPAPAP